MMDFLHRHSYVVIWILSLVIIGSLAVVILQLNQIGPAESPAAAGNAGGGSAASPQNTEPAISLSVQLAKRGNSFVVVWHNLPDGTAALDIYRGKTGTDRKTWELWRQVIVAPGSRSNGSASFNIGTTTEAGYSFYAAALGANGAPVANGTSGQGAGTNPPGPTVLWTSDSTTAPVTSPTATNTSFAPAPSSTAAASTTTTTTSTSTTISSQQTASSSTTVAPATSTSTTSTAQSSPTGIPYYNPRIQITAYGTPPGTFTVTRLNQSIQISWQNIPTGVDTITVSRASSTAGPWSEILIEHNPGTSGSYTLGLIDSAVNEANYYEMTALENSTTVATYGPDYLPAN